jgi:hypothetical protein
MRTKKEIYKELDEILIAFEEIQVTYDNYTVDELEDLVIKVNSRILNVVADLKYYNNEFGKFNKGEYEMAEVLLQHTKTFSSKLSS